MSDQQDLMRAEKARAILTDPMVEDAFQYIADQVRDAFFELDPSDSGARERLLLLDKARQQFRNVFELHLVTGRFAREHLISEQAAADEVARIRQLVKER